MQRFPEEYASEDGVKRSIRPVSTSIDEISVE